MAPVPQPARLMTVVLMPVALALPAGFRNSCTNPMICTGLVVAVLSNTGTVTSESLTITRVVPATSPGIGLPAPAMNSKGAVGGFAVVVVDVTVSPPPVTVAWVRQFTASAVSEVRVVYGLRSIFTLLLLQASEVWTQPTTLFW